jgi:ribose 1,5-bisphosphokinase
MVARLFYVIGASGAGKDSLLGYAREHMSADMPVVFAHRYITRPAATGNEGHTSLTPTEFALRLQHGCFAMHWESHGLSYGIGVEIRHWMQQGLHVVINGSRAYLERAAADFSNLVPILIQVDDAVLRQRLAWRGRESPDQVAQRIRRNAELQRSTAHPKLVRIDNNDELPAAGRQLLRLLAADTA